MNIFFNEITAILSKAAIKYENIIIIGDFNVDIKNKGLGHRKLDTFCDLFNLINLIHLETCLMKILSLRLIYFWLINLNHFLQTCTTETGRTDPHELISTFF